MKKGDEVNEVGVAGAKFGPSLIEEKNPPCNTWQGEGDGNSRDAHRRLNRLASCGSLKRHHEGEDRCDLGAYFFSSAKMWVWKLYRSTRLSLATYRAFSSWLE
jgi:hypothetical protein